MQAFNSCPSGSKKQQAILENRKLYPFALLWYSGFPISPLTPNECNPTPARRPWHGRGEGLSGHQRLFSKPNVIRALSILSMKWLLYRINDNLPCTIISKDGWNHVPCLANFVNGWSVFFWNRCLQDKYDFTSTENTVDSKKIRTAGIQQVEGAWTGGSLTTGCWLYIHRFRAIKDMQGSTAAHRQMYVFFMWRASRKFITKHCTVNFAKVFAGPHTYNLNT